MVALRCRGRPSFPARTRPWSGSSAWESSPRACRHCMSAKAPRRASLISTASSILRLSASALRPCPSSLWRPAASPSPASMSPIRANRRELADVPRQRVVLLGAGGAGAAVAHALLTLGVGELSIIDTEGARADRLAAGLRDRFGEGRAIAARDLAEAVDAAGGIVNATPVGMANHAGMPVARELLR